jgi:hypothetical protein
MRLLRSTVMPAGCLLLALALAACTPPAPQDTPTAPLEGAAPAFPTQITIPFLSAGANGILSRCAMVGSQSECVAARGLPEMDDGAYSYIHAECNAGEARYCRLLENLVDAELNHP